MDVGRVAIGLSNAPLSLIERTAALDGDLGRGPRRGSQATRWSPMTGRCLRPAWSRTSSWTTSLGLPRTRTSGLAHGVGRDQRGRSLASAWSRILFFLAVGDAPGERQGEVGQGDRLHNRRADAGGPLGRERSPRNSALGTSDLPAGGLVAERPRETERAALLGEPDGICGVVHPQAGSERMQTGFVEPWPEGW